MQMLKYCMLKIKNANKNFYFITSSKNSLLYDSNIMFFNFFHRVFINTIKKANKSYFSIYIYSSHLILKKKRLHVAQDIRVMRKFV